MNFKTAKMMTKYRVCMTFIHFSHLSTFFVQFVESYNFKHYSYSINVPTAAGCS